MDYYHNHYILYRGKKSRFKILQFHKIATQNGLLNSNTIYISLL